MVDMVENFNHGHPCSFIPYDMVELVDIVELVVLVDLLVTTDGCS